MPRKVAKNRVGAARPDGRHSPSACSEIFFKKKKSRARRDEDSLTHLCFKDAPTRKAIEVIGFVLNLFVIIVYLLFLWALRGM